MHKKVLAILLTASMVMSAPMAVMAGEADSTASGQEVESAAAAEDDAQTTESAAEETASAAEETASAAEEMASTAEETASAAEEAASAAEEAESVAEEAESVAEEAESVAEEAESAAEEVDFRELVKAYMTEIGEAVANVDLAEKIALTTELRTTVLLTRRLKLFLPWEKWTSLNWMERLQRLFRVSSAMRKAKAQVWILTFQMP